MSTNRRDFLGRAVALGALGLAALRDDWQARVQAAQARAAGRSPEDVAADEDYWFEIKSAFTVDRSVINLNNGGVSPSPRVVQDAMRRHLEYANNAPARNLWQIQDPQVETVRERLARAFGCGVDEMAITRNSSEALEICLFGLDLKAGDEVLTSTLDYPRMINTIKQRGLREGVVLRQIDLPLPVEDHAQVVAAFRKGITPKTKLLLCSHVIFLTGQILSVRDVVRLGREHDIPVIVDGAHAFAHFPFTRDELECDYYGTSLHKWLTAPHGTGFLYVRKQRIADLWPLMAAPEPRGGDIRKFEEIGTHPAANRLAIAEALTFHEAIGPARKAARLRYLRDRWVRRLTADKRVTLYTRLEPQHACGIATMKLDGVDPARVVEHLWNQHRIIVVNIVHDIIKGVRVTPNVYTTVEEIDLFCDAMEALLAKGLPA